MAETLRVATYNVDLGRKGPGLMLRDILKPDAQVQAVVAVIAQVQPDILFLQGIDYDHDLHGLRALRDHIAQAQVVYPHVYAAIPNTGMPTGVDVDGDGRLGGARDAQGYGWFSGSGGMALLSRFPIKRDQVQDLSAILWIDLPGSNAGKVLVSPAVRSVQRLSTVGHWVVPVETPGGALTLLGFHATPPVFDGPEDRNGLRNGDELRLWQAYLDGAYGQAPQEKFVLLGDANNDPLQGEGRKPELMGLLLDPRLQDVEPVSDHYGTATVDWPKTGRFRVDYVLPSQDMRVLASGVYWPEAADPMAQTVAQASRHRLVWVDLALR
ncbi:MAG: endonuclease/exonuclease/phosphatase family protein [Thalassovita sp.]